MDADDYCNDRYGTGPCSSPGSRQTNPLVCRVAAAGARRPRPPHCYIMVASGTDDTRSIPGEGLTCVRSLPKPTSTPPVGSD